MSQTVKFIHAADLHIDSPLRGLEVYEGAPLEQLRGATRAAVSALVRLAVEQQVDFVVIAGDLFDGKWPDMHTGLWTAARFRELDDAGIRVFLLRGNHDAASKVRSAVAWPANVHVFAVDQPETVVLEQLGVALHGQGFAREKITDDLAADYPEPVADCFNIGVLHTSLTGSTEHDTYAPTNVSTLVGRGYDYWALGHIHARSDPPVNRQPFIAYSGNTQGRHIRETGAKGCLVVCVADGELEDVTFQPTDTLRWDRLQVPLDIDDDRELLLSKLNARFATALAASDGRYLALRVMITGACRLHDELSDATRRAEVIAEVRNLANSIGDELWVEKVQLTTSPPVDIERLRGGQDLFGQLLRELATVTEDADRRQQIADLLSPLRDKLGAELAQLELDFAAPEQLQFWVDQAEQQLVARILEHRE